VKFFAICGVAVLLVCAAFAVACSDSGGGSLTLDEYFQKLDEIQNNSDAFFATQQASTAEPSPDASGEEVATFLRNNVSDSASALRDAGTAAGRLEPPDEVADAHADIVAAINGAADALDSAAGAVPDTIAFEELTTAADTLFNNQELSAAQEAITTACKALEAIATDNNITVDLACEA
jgi:hypothetical protein